MKLFSPEEREYRQARREYKRVKRHHEELVEAGQYVLSLHEGKEPFWASIHSARRTHRHRYKGFDSVSLLRPVSNAPAMKRVRTQSVRNT